MSGSLMNSDARPHLQKRKEGNIRQGCELSQTIALTKTKKNSDAKAHLRKEKFYHRASC